MPLYPNLQQGSMKHDPIIAEQMKHLPTGSLTVLMEDILKQPTLFQRQPPIPHMPPSDYYEMCVLSQIRTELIEGELQMKQIKRVHTNQLLFHRPSEL